MATWRVVVILLMGSVCLVLGSATVVVPMTDGAADHPWLWLVGLLFATAVMGALFAAFLRSSGRAFSTK